MTPDEIGDKVVEVFVLQKITDRRLGELEEQLKKNNSLQTRTLWVIVVMLAAQLIKAVGIPVPIIELLK